MGKEERTGSSLPDFFRHYPKDRDNLNHDLYDNISHGCRWSDLYICLKALEKEFHAAKDVDKSIFASAHILNGLKENPNTSKYSIRRWEYLWSHTSEGKSRAA